VKKLFLN